MVYIHALASLARNGNFILVNTAPLAVAMKMDGAGISGMVFNVAVARADGRTTMLVITRLAASIIRITGAGRRNMVFILAVARAGGGKLNLAAKICHCHSLP